MNFAPYPKYKPSDVEWLSHLPEHWDVKPLRSVFRFSKGLTITREDLRDDGVSCVNYGEIHSKFGFRLDPDVHQLRSVALDYLDSNPDALIYNGDFVFADTSEDLPGCGNFTYLCTDNLIFAGYHTIIGRPRVGISSLYLAYLIDSSAFRSQIQKQARGVKVFSITQGILKAAKCVCPPLPEQRVIAAFLDRETAKIDALVEEQRKLIELLKEKRQALITHAVTKGLNPKAKMKDSGIEWLGQVPEHWDFRKLSHLGNIVGGGTPSRNNPDYWNGDIPWVSSKDIKVAHISDSEEHITSRGLAESTTRLVQPGTILMVVRSGILQHTLPVAISRSTVAINQDIKAIAFFEDTIVASYFRYFVVGYNNQLLYDWSTQGATVESIDMNLLRKTLIPVPPVDEQEEIALHLQHDGQRFDGLIHEASTAIELLTERRTALISAAVTGKIDVRDMIDEEATT